MGVRGTNRKYAPVGKDTNCRILRSLAKRLQTVMFHLHLLLPPVMSPLLCCLTYAVFWRYPLKFPVTYWTQSLTSFLRMPHAPKLAAGVITDAVTFLLLPPDHVSSLSCWVSLCPLTSDGPLLLDTRGSQGFGPSPKCLTRISS